jgi:parafibromin
MSIGDSLLLLRSSIAASSLPLLTTSADVKTAELDQTDSLALATHLYFSSPLPQCLPLNGPTRFTSTTPDTLAVDLRSIYFAWIKKDVPVNEYIALAQELDGKLPEGQKIRNLVFVERLDLITWLEGASDESEYIKALEGPGADGTDPASKAVDVVGGIGVPAVPGAGVGVVQQTGVGGRPVKVIDARLQEIYNGERPMGDRNSVLRGIKPTVSCVFGNKACFRKKKRVRPFTNALSLLCRISLM